MKNLRILQLTHNYPSESDKTEGIFLHRINRLLIQECDLDISVILMKPKFGFASFNKEYTIDGINVKLLNYFRPRGRIFNGFDGAFMLSALGCICELDRKFDLIHSHWQTDSGLLGTFTSKRFYLPHLVSVRGARIFSKKPKSIYGLISSYVFKNANTIHTHGSNIQKELVRKYKINESSINWVPNPIFNELQLTFLLAKSENKQVDDKNFNFLFIGLDGKHKGLMDAVQAFLSSNTKNCKLIVVTDTSRYFYRSKVQPMIEGNKKIMVYDKTSPDKIFELFKEADVFLFPSYREGAPNVVLEAMAAGCYIIGYDIPGLDGLVIHNMNGRLVKKKNIDSLIEEINLFVSGKMKDQFLTFYEYNKKFISDNYDTEKIIRDYQYMYSNCLGK